MKRLVWLLIACFCTVMAQVQPVDLWSDKDQECCCCEDQAGACGMPECVPNPVSSQARVVLPAGSPVLAQLKRSASVPLKVREPFYAKLVKPSAVVPALRVTDRGTPAASVSLFKAHCTLLV